MSRMYQPAGMEFEVAAGSLESALEYEDEIAAQYEADYSVIGPVDDRFRIPARPRRPSTLLFPTNTICFLQITNSHGKVFPATGTLIAPQVVLTAKHVLMDVRPPCGRAERVMGPTYPRIVVTPGADFAAGSPRLRRPATPQSIPADSTRFRVDPNLDYGVIILPAPFRALPDPFRGGIRFMMLQPRSAPRTATLLTIAGYPCDKPSGTMWGHSGRIPLSRVTDTHLYYTIDTCPGHSGSPIWLLGNAGIRLLLGVHTSGVNATNASRCFNDPRPGFQCEPTGAPVTPVRGENCGVRITCPVIDNILRWCREFGVTGPVIDQAAYRRACAPR